MVSHQAQILQWMMEAGLWMPHRRRNAVVHQQRERRPCFGELVQIDGSPHDWFEGRAEKCCLLIFIDDATSRLLHLRFEPAETTESYFRSVHAYLKQHGTPVAFYSDRHGIFRINAPDVVGEAQTQFGRAMEALNIEIICANSPQAKGRVEKANRTLQDRLVTEILCYHTDRTLSKNLELSYSNIIYQVKIKGEGYALRHVKVSVHEHLDGQVSLYYKGRKLNYTTHQKQKRITAIVSAKDLNKKMETIIKQDGRTKGHKPKMEHPWRRYEQKKLVAKQPAMG